MPINNFPNNKKNRFGNGLIFYVLVTVVIISIAYMVGGNALREKELLFSDVMESLENNKIEQATFSGNNLEIILKSDTNNPLNKKVIKKTVSPYWMAKLLEKFDDSNVKYDYKEPINFSLVVNALTMILMFGSMGFFLWIIYSRQGGDGKSAMSFARSRARLADPSKNNVSFNDVAGADEEKAELQEVVDFLKNPSKYESLGAKIPRGILLVGPPGTGKTLLAKAVAGEAGVPFFSISGSDFVEMFVGVGASRVRDLFEQAKKNAPSIIFIDEIDAVGRQRGTGLGGGHDEREQTLNQLLVEMDGFGPNLEAIVMAATNRPDILDPALLRPGRFDRRVTVSRPDMNGRKEILKVHARNKPIDNNVDLAEIARMTPGFTGADLSNLLNEAALTAARRNSKSISYADIADSVFKVMLGPEKKSHVVSEKERKLTAYHEAGHAIILRTCSETDRVERITIIPAGDAGGYTAYKPHEDVNFRTKEHLLQSIKHALGGRAAEEIILGEISTGASGDLRMINDLARSMITEYGMSDKLPNMVFGQDSGQVFIGRDYGHVKNFSEETARIIDEEVKLIVDRCYQEVLSILRDKINTLHAVAKRLLENERVEGAEFERIYQETTTAEQRANDAQNPGLNDRYLSDYTSESDSNSNSAKLINAQADSDLVSLSPTDNTSNNQNSDDNNQISEN